MLSCNGTANLFLFLNAHRLWRKVKMTAQRTARNFAECMRDLIDLRYFQAEQIRIVLDNLSTHTRERSMKPSRHPKHIDCCVV